jgi:iron complex outermembrane receptor protein
VSFGRLGTSFRLPHVDDVGFTLPNTSLKAQSSKDFEAGLRWSDSLNNAELRIYRNNFQNEIAYDATVINANSWNGFGANVNLDPTMRQGVEFRGKFSANENLSLLVNTGFREAKFSEGVHAGNNIPLAANATAAVATEWDIGRGQSLTMGINWVSSKSVDIDNKCSVPAIATLSTGYRFENKNISFTFGIENLSDLKYYTVAYTCTAGVTNGIYPEAGRTFTATGKIVF